MKATEEMIELQQAIEAAGASEKLTHCSILAGELATRIAKMEKALEDIANEIDGDTRWPEEIAQAALEIPEFPKPRSFGRITKV